MRTINTNPNDNYIQGQLGDYIRVVKTVPDMPWVMVSMYQWVEKRVRTRKDDYLYGGWHDLGGQYVGLWLLMYCGPEKPPGDASC